MFKLFMLLKVVGRLNAEWRIYQLSEVFLASDRNQRFSDKIKSVTFTLFFSKRMILGWTQITMLVGINKVCVSNYLNWQLEKPRCLVFYHSAQAGKLFSCRQITFTLPSFRSILIRINFMRFELIPYTFKIY